MPTTTKTKRLSFLDAFEFLGRKKSANWVGWETRARPKHDSKSAGDIQSDPKKTSDEELQRRMRAEIGELRGLSWANSFAELWGPQLRESMGRDPEGWFLEKPEMEPERKIHREAEAEWLPPPGEAWEKIKKGFSQRWWPDPESNEYLEAHEAWARHVDTLAALRTTMSEHNIGSFLLIAGQEVRLENSQWDPDNEAFEIDLLNGVCGEGNQKGFVVIEWEPFIAVVDLLYPIPPALGREARSDGGSAKKYSEPFQHVVNHVRKRLGQKVTVKKLLDDLLEQIAEAPLGELSLLRCENICVAGNGTITWDEPDKDGLLEERSIQPYLNRANAPT